MSDETPTTRSYPPVDHAALEAADFTLDEHQLSSARYAAVRSIVRGYQDMQRARLAQNNRVQQAGLAAAGIDSTVKQAKKQAAEKAAELMQDYDTLAEVMVKKYTKGEEAELTKNQFDKLLQATPLPNGLLSNFFTFQTCQQLRDLEKAEHRALLSVQRALKELPIWNEFLAHVKGVGPSLGGTIVASIDISKAKYASSLWAYSGYDVAPNGRGRSRRKEHLEEHTYIDAEGNEAKRLGITFNPLLKTKLFLLAEQFCRQRDASPYYQVYRDYKHRMENHAVYGTHNDGEVLEGIGTISKGRRDAMAKRYAIKRFLVDLYKAWRTLEGFPVHPEYSEAKLGMTHSRP